MSLTDVSEQASPCEGPSSKAEHAAHETNAGEPESGPLSLSAQTKPGHLMQNKEQRYWEQVSGPNVRSATGRALCSPSADTSREEGRARD